MPNHSSVSASTAFLLLTLAAAPASAFQPLVTDDTGTQGAGGNQIEFSFNQDRQKAGGETQRTRTLPLVYTRGVSETLDLFAGISQVRIRSSLPGGDASGVGNPVFGAKWRFYENEASKTSLGFKPQILLPVGGEREAKGLGDGRTSFGATAILTQELPFGALHANLGLARDRYRDPAFSPDKTTLHASLAPVWDLGEQWKLALDFGGDRASGGGTTVYSRYGEIGVVYSPHKDLDFALGFIHSRDNASPKAATETLTLGVTWRFK